MVTVCASTSTTCHIEALHQLQKRKCHHFHCVLYTSLIHICAFAIHKQTGRICPLLYYTSSAVIKSQSENRASCIKT